MEDYAASLTPQDVTEAGNFKAPSREVEMKYASIAWEKVATETIVNRFNLCKRVLEEYQNNLEELKVREGMALQLGK